MAGLSMGLAKGFKAEAAITKRRIIKFGATDTGALMAAAGADFAIGVSSEIDAIIGEPCDVFLNGTAEVEAGAAIARGALLMSDGVGRAITAAAAAGTNVRIIGFALAAASGVGDIIPLNLEPGSFQG